MSYARTKVWVWFKGGLDGGAWRGGFYATDYAENRACELINQVLAAGGHKKRLLGGKA